VRKSFPAKSSLVCPKIVCPKPAGSPYSKHLFGYNIQKPEQEDQAIKHELNAADITAIEPCYGKEGGNATRIYTKSGKIYTENRRLKTVLTNLAGGYGYTLANLRNNYAELLGFSQSLPQRPPC
jgi:hypothetical protein